MRKIVMTTLTIAALAGCSSLGKVGAATTSATSATSPPATPDATVATATPSTSAIITTPRASTPTPTEPPATTAPTTAAAAAAKKGTRANPWRTSEALTLGNDINHFGLTAIEPVDDAVIHEANQFNDPTPAGKTWVRVAVTASYSGTATASGHQLVFALGIVGDKSKVYKEAFAADGEPGVLDQLHDQPDVIAGGTLTGYVYFIVDSDDANFLGVVNGSTFVAIGP